MSKSSLAGLEILGPMNSRYAEILTPEACAFVAGLVRAAAPF
jgi:hypothetical protein